MRHVRTGRQGLQIVFYENRAKGWPEALSVIEPARPMAVNQTGRKPRHIGGPVEWF